MRCAAIVAPAATDGSTGLLTLALRPLAPIYSQVRITSAGKTRNYISYATNLLTGEGEEGVAKHDSINNTMIP